MSFFSNAVTSVLDSPGYLRKGTRTRAASAAPTRGPTHITHKCCNPSDGVVSQLRTALTIAGPKDRVGLIEQPSIGKRNKCDKNTANPIAMQALIPQVLCLATAVSHTT